MGIHSGTFGTINGIPAVRNWQIADEGSLAAFVNSGTRRAVGRRKGVTQWGGGYAAHGAQPVVMPGEFFAFAGYTAPDNDVEGSNGLIYSGDAIVDSVGVAWDWAGGQVLQHQVGFGGHLVLSKAVGAAIADSEVSDPEPVCGTKIQYSADGVTWTELPDLTQAQLSISAANSAYVNSSTGCGTGRKAGAIDWSVSISVENNSLGAGLVKFNNYWLRLFTTATKYYELKFGQVRGFSGLTVDEESGRIISHTINIEANAVVGNEVGHIILPDSVVWWGV